MLFLGVTGDGGKKSIYALTGDNTMRATHVVWGKLLGEPPLTWTVDYTRAQNP